MVSAFDIACYFSEYVILCCRFTSNNIETFKIDPDDRRFVLLHCSDRYVGNVEYMRHLLMQLRRPKVARALYQFFMSRDLSKYKLSFQDNRPRTRSLLQPLFFFILYIFTK